MACNSSFHEAIIMKNAEGEPAVDDGNFVFVLPGEFIAVLVVLLYVYATICLPVGNNYNSLCVIRGTGHIL